MRKLVILLAACILFINLSYAQIGYDNPNLPRVEPVTIVVESFLDLTDTPSTYDGSNNFCLVVNGTEVDFTPCNSTASNFSIFADIWITSDGNLDNTQDIRNLENITVNISLNMSGNPIEEAGNITFEDRLFIGDKDHWLRRNADLLFNGISEEAFWFHHQEEHSGGTISFLVTSNVSDQNVVNILSQVGRNNSAGVLGNSWMVLPNNLTDNLTIFSDCILVASELNKTIRVRCDTADSGADFVVQDDIQSWGRLFSDDGIRSENEIEFILNGFDLDVSGGAMHLRDSRLEQVGFTAGENVTLLTADFSGGLTPFEVLNPVIDLGEWLDIADINCFDSPCARAGKLAPSAETTMFADFVTTNFSSLNLSFQLTTLNLDAGDLFNVTVNNGSGEVEVFAIADGIDVDTLTSVVLPVSMENKSTVNVSFSCDVNSGNEECFVDDVMIVGTASVTTLANITRFDTLIKGGSTGTEDIFIFYNDTLKQWTFSPGNVSLDIAFTNIAFLNNTQTFTGENTMNADLLMEHSNLSLNLSTLTISYNGSDFNQLRFCSGLAGIVLCDTIGHRETTDQLIIQANGGLLLSSNTGIFNFTSGLPNPAWTIGGLTWQAFQAIDSWATGSNLLLSNANLTVDHIIADSINATEEVLFINPTTPIRNFSWDPDDGALTITGRTGGGSYPSALKVTGKISGPGGRRALDVAGGIRVSRENTAFTLNPYTISLQDLDMTESYMQIRAGGTLDEGFFFGQENGSGFGGSKGGGQAGTIYSTDGPMALYGANEGTSGFSNYAPAGLWVYRDKIDVGSGRAATDYAIFFDGESSDGNITWMEDEAHFRIHDDVVIDGELNVTGHAFFGLNITLANGGKLWDNATCTFLASPDGTTVQEICNA